MSFLRGQWFQIVGVCWAAVFIWLIVGAVVPANEASEIAALPTPVPTREDAPTETATPTATSTTAPTPTGSAEPCKNSFEPRCGQFRWDPAPKNRQMTIDADVTSGEPKAGEIVKIEVVAEDDTTFVEGYNGQWGDGSPPFGIHGDCTAGTPAPARYGPWTPPEQERDTYTFEVEHTYEAAGTYEFVVRVSSGGGCEADSRYPNPHGETGEAKLKLVVSD